MIKTIFELFLKYLLWNLRKTVKAFKYKKQLRAFWKNFKQLWRKIGALLRKFSDESFREFSKNLKKIWEFKKNMQLKMLQKIIKSGSQILLEKRYESNESHKLEQDHGWRKEFSRSRGQGQEQKN